MEDKTEIIRALRQWFQPGDVFELRILDAVTSEYQRPHVESGYFDFEHIEAVPAAMAKLRCYRGAYVTVNPVNPALLARAVNRIRSVGREPTTADSDILCRRWLLIDCDAERPSGISSTDAEHDAALYKAMEIQEGLSSLGWTEPLMVDSGNGAQLMYRIDLPAADGELVAQCVAEIAKASDNKVKIDLTVHNPARIWRLPGTMNCKGDSTAERPHRMAKVVSVPTHLKVLSANKLTGLIDTRTEVQPVPQSQSDFRIDDWIRRHCPELGTPQEWKNGRKWTFAVCPFNSAHNNRSAVLIEQPSGAIAFTCHHNGCKSNDWRKLRELKEPGCYDEPPVPTPVDLSGILKAKPQKMEAPEFKSPGEIPEAMLRIPGFVDEYVKFIMTTAPYPNRVLAFCGALAFLAFLAGRRVKDERNNRTNIYLVALAQPSTGKDHPRQVNLAVASAHGLGASVAEAFGSGEGLEDAVYLHPAILFEVDEFDTVFNALKYGKDGRGETVMEKLLRFYGSSKGIYKMRKLAMKKQEGEHLDDDRKIINPCLAVYGTAVPKFFYESLSQRVLLNGLAARCMILDSGKRGRGNGDMSDMDTIPANISRAIEAIKKYGMENNLCTEYPSPMVIRAMPDAAVMMKQLNIKYDDKYDSYEARKEAIPMAFWGRAFEKVCKLSMLYGISSNVEHPVITIEAVKWASSFVDFLTEQMLFMVDAYSYENAFDEKCRKVIRFISEAGKPIAHGILLKKSHESSEILKQIVETLEENGSITHCYEGSGAKQTKFYSLA